MWAELDTRTAMMADDWFLLIAVKADRMHHAGFHTPSASYATVRIQVDSTAFSWHECTCRTHFCAMGLMTGMADNSDKLAGKTAGSPYMDTTFSYGMIVAIDSGTDQHTGKTTDTLVHLVSFKNLRQIISSCYVVTFVNRQIITALK